MRTLLPIAAVLAIAGNACVIVADDEADLTVHNHSDFVLTAVHVAKVDAPHWGPNLLPDPLYPREDLVVRDIDCGTYDVLVVDSAGLECELPHLAMCFQDEGWVVTNTTLAACAFRP